MKLDINKDTDRLYVLNTLDPFDGREDEAEDLVRPYIRNGFRYHNTIIFVSEVAIDKISTHIRKYKSERFQFLLTDITDNIQAQKFIGVINPKYYPVADKAASIIKAFKPILPELSEDEKFEALMDRVSQKGMKSLNKDEKTWLDNYSKNLPEYKKKDL